MIPVLDHFAALLITVGYNQAVGDHRATHTPGAAEPVRPDLPFERGLGSLRLVTTGHGTGHGVVDNGSGFAASVGHLVSDADKDDLLGLATAWREAGDEDVTTELRSASALAREVDADEARGAVEDIADLIGALETCRRQTTRLATYCTEQFDEVVELRESRLPQLLAANAAALGVVEVAPRADALAVVFRPSASSAPLEAFTRSVVDDLHVRQVRRVAEVERFAGEDIGEPRRVTDDINSRPIAEMSDSGNGPTNADPAARTVRDRAGAEEVLGRDAIRIKKSSSIIYSKDGGVVRAESDFAIVSQGYEVRYYDGDVRSVTLEDGSHVTIRPSSDGRVTVSIQPPTGSDRKYRYNP